MNTVNSKPESNTLHGAVGTGGHVMQNRPLQLHVAWLWTVFNQWTDQSCNQQITHSI